MNSLVELWSAVGGRLVDPGGAVEHAPAGKSLAAGKCRKVKDLIRSRRQRPVTLALSRKKCYSLVGGFDDRMADPWAVGSRGGGMFPMRSFVACIVCVLTISNPAAADRFEAGRAAWDGGDLDSALTLLLPLAERGDREAQYLVGRIELCGDGLPIDLVSGFGWYLRAAEQGHPDAQYAVGHEYAMERAGGEPDPIPEDLVESYIWFSLAALGYGVRNPERRLIALDMRDRIGKRLTAQERADAEGQVATWKPLAGAGQRD